MSDVEVKKYRKGTAVNVRFPTLNNLTVQPRRIDIHQKQYTHDILTLEYPAESTQWFESLHTGVPVQFSWNQDTLSKNWIGYVSHVSRQNSAQRTNPMQIVCVGATFVLKERVTRVFNQSTITSAVKKIVEEYGFSYHGIPNKEVFSQLTIPGISYWEWIVEQAKRIGYGILIDGMDFYFSPIDRLIDQGFSASAILSLGDATIPFNMQAFDRTLDSFRVISGDNIEDTVNSRAIKTVGGVDPVTNTIYTATLSPADSGTGTRDSISDVLFSEYRTDRVVSSKDSASAAVVGAAEMARFNLPAVVKGQGDPRIRPFGSVFISGTGNFTDGFWMVREAQHMFHAIGDYMVNLKIVTDGLGDTVQTPFRQRNTIGVGTINPEDIYNDGKIITNFFDMDRVTLSSADIIIKEGSQGYVRTPQSWKAVGA